MREESETSREVYVKIAGRLEEKTTWEWTIVDECDSFRIVGGAGECTGGA